MGRTVGRLADEMDDEVQVMVDVAITPLWAVPPASDVIEQARQQLRVQLGALAQAMAAQIREGLAVEQRASQRVSPIVTLQ